jgi:hypothetical protein
VPAYLFLWDPEQDKDSFRDFENLVLATSLARRHRIPWRCKPKGPQPGDEAYMKRTGPLNNGLFARGFVVRAPHTPDSQGRRRVELSLYSILALGSEISGPILATPPLNSMRWNQQRSGIEIRPESAQALDRLWPHQTMRLG